MNNHNGSGDQSDRAMAQEKVHEPGTENGDLTARVEQLMQEVTLWKERALRSMADFENFKRRTEKEQISWVRSSKAAVLRNLLPIIDDFERARTEHEKLGSSAESQSWRAGIEMINTALVKFLKNAEVTEITDNDTFDPLLHEAIVQVESPDHSSGHIVDVLQKGYLLGDQVLRPARVTVAK